MMEVKHRKAIYREVFNWHENRLEALAACSANGIDNFWKETCNSICEVSSLLQDQPFAADLLVAVFQELERIAEELQLKRAGSNL